MLGAGMDQQQKNTNNLPPFNSFDFLGNKFHGKRACNRKTNVINVIFLLFTLRIENIQQ